MAILELSESLCGVTESLGDTGRAVAEMVVRLDWLGAEGHPSSLLCELLVSSASHI